MYKCNAKYYNTHKKEKPNKSDFTFLRNDNK